MSECGAFILNGEVSENVLEVRGHVVVHMVEHMVKVTNTGYA